MPLSEEQIKRITYITRKKETLEEQIEALKTRVANHTVSSTNASLRLSLITPLFKDYIRYNEDLKYIQADHPLREAFAELETNYFDLATTITDSNSAGPSASSTLNTTNFTISERQNLPKLPEIKITSFDGKREDWLLYKNRFVALVHSRTDISDYVKHTQLLNSLTGSARDKIVEFNPSEENYAKAWQTLLNAYDHKRLVAVEHLNAMLNLPVLTSAKVDSITNLIDKARQHIYLLDGLEVKSRDDVFVRIIERCLPPAMKSRWEEKVELDTLPKLPDLFKFMENYVFRLQSYDIKDSSKGNNKNAKKRTGDTVDKGKGKVAKAEATATSLVTTESSKVSCPKCNEDHRLFKCPVFDKLKVQERWNFIKENKVCRNCLNVHKLPCKNTKRCKKCEKDHHTLLHSEKKPVKSAKAETSQTEKEPTASTSTDSAE